MGVMVTTVRIPVKLKEYADKLVEEGYYKNFSDLVISGLRREVFENNMTLAVKKAREAKKAVWEEALKKARGDPDKAIKIMQKEAEKLYASDPSFWSL